MIKQNGIDSNDLTSKLIEEIQKYVDVEDTTTLKKPFSMFLAKLRVKFRKNHRMYKRLEERESDWLDTDIAIESKVVENNPQIQPEPSTPAGRPEKSWEQSAPRTKRRKTLDLATKHQTDALAAAVVVRDKDSPGKKDFGYVIKKSIVDATAVRKGIETKAPEPKMMNDANALALKVNCDLSDTQYQMIRNSSLAQDANIYPHCTRFWRPRSFVILQIFKLLKYLLSVLFSLSSIIP